MGRAYFLSDVHLGLDYKEPSKREREFVAFLNNLPGDTQALYLLGDIFDFWYEYKDVIPNKYTRTLGALANLADRGVKIYFINGNHDIWTYSYLTKEIGVTIIKQPYITTINGIKFCLAHGDGLVKGDYGYKLMNRLFKCRFLQILFSAIHPRWAFMLAHRWSRHNRLTKVGQDENDVYMGRWMKKLLLYCANLQRENNGSIDYFIFGHFHNYSINDVEPGGKLVILGDWINNPSYVEVTENEVYPVALFPKN